MRIRKSLSFKVAILTLIVGLIGVGSLAYFSYSQAQSIFLNNAKKLLKKDLEQYVDFISQRVEGSYEDIEMLALNPQIRGFLRSYYSPYRYDENTNKSFEQYYKDVEAIFRLVLKQNRRFFQIRVIDKNGKEIIKLVKKDDDSIELTNKEELQNKAHRDYFLEALKSPKNVYVSNIDLNREFKTLDFPLKSTIRFAKIVTDRYKRFLGLVIINIDVSKLFAFDKLRKRKDYFTLIANKEGYYILNTLDPNKEFGWEFGKPFTIDKDFPFLKPLLEGGGFLEFQTKDYILEGKRVFYSPDNFLVVVEGIKGDIFAKEGRNYIRNLVLFIIFVVLFMSIVSVVLVRRFLRPIKDLTEYAIKIAKGKDIKPIKIETEDEVEELSKAINIMLESLKKSQKELQNFAVRLKEEVDKKTKELQKMNENLQNIVEDKVRELREKDKALLQQSKLAIMGEMIGAIAHQWRQPLNTLAINIQNLEERFEDGDLTKKEIEEFVDKNMETIQFMSRTIDDFRNFFRKDKEKSVFNLKDIVQKTIKLQSAQLINNNIDVNIRVDDVEVYGYKNEFMQVLLNLVANAKDAILERRKKIPDLRGKIEIFTKIEGKKIKLFIKDNGGGIPKAIANRIFEPYFTTKEEGQGTGMGLYMAKDILQKMGWSLSFKNEDDGAVFIIEMEIFDADKT